MKFKTAKKIVDEFNSNWPHYGATYLKPDGDVPAGAVSLGRLSKDPEKSVLYIDSPLSSLDETGRGWLMAYTSIQCGVDLTNVQISCEDNFLSVFGSIIANEYTFLRSVLAPMNSFEVQLKNDYSLSYQHDWNVSLYWETLYSFMFHLESIARMDAVSRSEIRLKKMAAITLEKSRPGILNLSSSIYFSFKDKPEEAVGLAFGERMSEEINRSSPVDYTVMLSVNPDFPSWSAGLPGVVSELQVMYPSAKIELQVFGLEDSETEADSGLGFLIRRLDGTSSFIVNDDGLYKYAGKLGLEGDSYSFQDTTVVGESSKLEKLVTFSGFEYLHLVKTMMPLTDEGREQIFSIPETVQKQLLTQIERFKIFFDEVVEGDELALDTWSYEKAIEVISLTEDHVQLFESLV